MHTNCRRCNRVLKNPKYRELGLGSICLKKQRADDLAEKEKDGCPIDFKEDIKLWRDKKGYAQANIQQIVVKHSPSGFEWGYGGSGPADLALNILYHYTDKKTAQYLYQEFKAKFIATMPYEGGTLEYELVKHWLTKSMKESGDLFKD